jgi:hypothetical protein
MYSQNFPWHPTTRRDTGRSVFAHHNVSSDIHRRSQVFLDSNGMSVNGKNVTLPQTVVNTTQDASRLTAVFDTGDSFPQLPTSMVHAIYADVPGAQFQSDDNVWSLPCDSEINVVFYFGMSNLSGAFLLCSLTLFPNRRPTVSRSSP